MRRTSPIIWMVAAVLGFSGAAAADVPRVVVSIEPLNALVAGVMDRVGIPEVLVRGDNSPLDYRLRASQQRKLDEADLVIWAGNGVDDFMAEAVAGLPPTTRVIKVADLDLPVGLATRRNGLWEKPAAADGDDIDPYLWLDIDNAAAFVEVATRALIEIDREHKIDYGRNSKTVIARLGGLDRQLRRALDPFRGIPFVVQHDFFQYLERRYGLEAVGALMAGPDSAAPSEAHLLELSEEAEALGAACLMAQPQFDRAAADAFASEGGLTVVELDPFHSDASGVNAYFEMMRTLPKAVAACVR